MYIVPFNFHLGAEEPMGGGGLVNKSFTKGAWLYDDTVYVCMIIEFDVF